MKRKLQVHKTGGEMLCQGPIQMLIPFEIIADNNDKYNVSESLFTEIVMRFKILEDFLKNLHLLIHVRFKILPPL